MFIPLLLAGFLVFFHKLISIIRVILLLLCFFIVNIFWIISSFLLLSFLFFHIIFTSVYTLCDVYLWLILALFIISYIILL